MELTEDIKWALTNKEAISNNRDRGKQVNSLSREQFQAAVAEEHRRRREMGLGLINNNYAFGNYPYVTMGMGAAQVGDNEATEGYTGAGESAENATQEAGEVSGGSGESEAAASTAGSSNGGAGVSG
jgi:hypothetical protein